MAYVAVGLLVILVIALGVLILRVMGRRAAAHEDRESHTKAPFAGRDNTPLGDTAEYSGQQDEEGRTVSSSTR